MRIQWIKKITRLTTVGRRDGWKRLWYWGKFFLAGSLLYYLFTLTSWQEIVRSFSSVSWWHVILVFVAFICEMLLGSLRFWLLLEKKVPLGALLSINMLQKSLSGVLSTGVGFATYVADIKIEGGIRTGKGMASFLLAKIGDVVAIGFFFSLACISVWPDIGPLKKASLFINGAILMGVIGFIFMVYYRDGFIGFLSLKKEQSRIFRLIYGLVESLNVIPSGREWRYLGTILLLSLAMFGFGSLGSVMINEAFHIPIGYPAIVFMLGIQRLMSYIPIYVLGGIGVNEVTSMYMYTLFGIEKTTIAADLIGMRIVAYLWNLILLAGYMISKVLVRHSADSSGQG